MKKIIALGASNNRNSINKTLATYTANQIEQAEVLTLDLNDYGMPMYGIDEENEKGIPENALKLNSIIENADGIVISLAEHNGSYAAVFKNAFDWLSRIDKEVWKNKPMFLMATSPGARGGATVLESAKTSFPFLGGNIVADLAFPSFYDNFSDKQIINESLNSILNEKVTLFQNSVNTVSTAY